MAITNTRRRRRTTYSTHRRHPLRSVLIACGVILVAMLAAGVALVEVVESKVHHCCDRGGVVATIVNTEPTANEQSILINGVLQDTLEQAAKGHRSVEIDQIDGDGTVTAKDRVDMTPRLDDGTVLRVASRAHEATATAIGRIAAQLNATTATVPGAATFLGLEHLNLDTKAPILVITSLLDTADPLDYRKLDWDVPPAAVVKTLRGAHELPPLNGADMTLIVRPVAGRQRELRPAQLDYVKSVYRAVMRASGVKRLRFDFVDGSAPVATIEAPTVPIPPPPGTPVPVDQHGDCRVDTTAYFASDTARLLAPQATRAALRLCAARIAATARVRVTGWTAGDDPANTYAKRLSTLRAEQIAGLLHQLGVRNHITVRGLGNSHQPYPDPFDPRNRTVVVTVTG